MEAKLPHKTYKHLAIKLTSQVRDLISNLTWLHEHEHFINGGRKITLSGHNGDYVFQIMENTTHVESCSDGF